MTIIKRLRLLAAVLGTAAAVAVVGTVFGDIAANRSGTAVANRLAKPQAPATDTFQQSKFATQPTLSYTTPKGQTLFAWQVKPILAPIAAKERDLVVMVDTSASQAGLPLKRARQIIEGLVKTAAPGDRIDVWTININDAKATRSLTEGLKPASAPAILNAGAHLTELEFPAGATDLKAGLENGAKSFENNAARQQILLYLGDGESAATTEPFGEAARLELGTKFDLSNVAFFAVPLGLKVNSHNLHGLATLTGGAVVRLTEDTTTEHAKIEFANTLRGSFAVPVLKPTKVAFGPEVAETFPSRLPPLRADRATLVVGSLTATSSSITAKVTGLVDGVPTTVELADRMSIAESDNYFLHAMIEQWRTSPVKAAPAILAADRALALAANQYRLFREEFLTQAVFAINSDKYDHAVKLYEAAAKIDPASPEVTSGLKVIKKLQTGELTRAKMKTQLNDHFARANLQGLADDKPAGAGGAPAGGAPAAAGPTPLQQAQAERAVLEQQFRVLVDDTIRQARQLFRTDPDGAYENLKRQRDLIQSNPSLSETTRSRLAADLESMMQTVNTQGAAIKRTIAEERARIAATKLKINEFEREQAVEEQTKARMDSFRQLMNQGRYEIAQQEAQLLIQERMSRGQVVPPEAVASYMIGQAATNLREHRELVRIREDRYLLTMMQVEKSFIPYPDEPPVHFPPAAIWRELSAEREKYKSASIGADVPETMRKIQTTLEGPTAQRVKIESELDSLALKDVLGQLEKDHGLKFVVLEEAFKTQQSEAAILEKKFPLKQKLYGITVGAFLDLALPSVGAYYIVRPEYIEITTYENRFTEKVVKAFDVTELVYQVPSSINQAALQQNQSVQATNLQLFGQATFAGGFGAVGGATGLIGGGIGGGIGGLGGIGGGLQGGGIGGIGGQGGGFQGGGGFGGGGAGNLGAGGGVAGVGGGQLGQFGNLGGQFGIQGNALPNYNLLVELIQEVVARGEWVPLNPQFQVAAQNPNAQQDDQRGAPILEDKYLNSLAFYPPTSSLIVRGSGKYHPGSSVKYKKPEGSAQGPGNPLRNRVANANGAGGRNGAATGNVADQIAMADKPGLKNPINEISDMKKSIDLNNPMRMWQQAIEKAQVKEPGLVVACADFLMEGDAAGHAAEILKAGIRSGLTGENWAHEALAIALKEGKASTTDVQRAAMSLVDLEPANASAYLKAAKSAEENGDVSTALSFCKKASLLEPNVPAAYANALVYAGKVSDVQTDVIHWATANLLQRDWTNDDGVDYHAQTKDRLGKIVKKFEANGQGAQIEKLRGVLEQDKQRDLVIELLWQGEADLDLSVREPSASTANATNKRTVGGGVLKSDILEQQNDRSEVYTAAQALSGTYTINVKKSLGRPIGNTARLQVTKFKGTNREVTDLYVVNLDDPKPLTISLDGGSRTDLALLPADEVVAKVEQNAANTTVASTVTAGVSAVTDTNRTASSATKLPTVIQPLETRLAGVSADAPSLRAKMDVTPDRKNVTLSVNPVFTGAAKEIPMPKVSLLPGAE